MALFLNTYCPPIQEEITLEAPVNLPEPDFQSFFTLAAQYSSIATFIFVGEDLSYLKAIYLAVGKYHTTKHVHFLESADPADIEYVKRKSSTTDSLVVAIDKTGTSETVMKNLLALEEYQKLVICKKESPLKKIQEIKELAFVSYEESFFESITTAVLVPITLLYINVQEFFDGVKHMFAQCHPGKKGRKPALDLARCMSNHNPQIKIFGNQLRGMHILAAKYLQIQGAKKLHIPIIAQKPISDIHLTVPYEFKEIPYADGTLEMLEGSSLHQAQLTEFETVCAHARENEESLCTITIDDVSPHTLGELIALFEFVALYQEAIKD